MELQFDYIVREITTDDYRFAPKILEAMNYSAAKRGTGIEDRPLSYFHEKMDQGLGVIAVHAVTGEWVGFCCIEVWKHKKYIANTGLIIPAKYRGLGISRAIKFKLFDLCRSKYPSAKIFSLTANQAVINVNIELGYQIESFDGIISDKFFLTGCSSWVDYISLMKRGHTKEHDYVAMVFDPLSIEARNPGSRKELVSVNNQGLLL